MPNSKTTKTQKNESAQLQSVNASTLENAKNVDAVENKKATSGTSQKEKTKSKSKVAKAENANSSTSNKKSSNTKEVEEKVTQATQSDGLVNSVDTPQKKNLRNKKTKELISENDVEGQQIADAPTLGEEKKKRTVGDIVALILTVILLAIVAVCVILVIIGFRPAVVLTPSMRPAIDPGDLIIYKAVDAETIEVGDVITFWPSEDSEESNELSVTHRVIEIRANGDGTLTFITHGDANSEGSNETVTQDRVIGKVFAVIPWVGQLFLFIRNNLLVVIFAIVSIVILCYLLKYLYKSIKKDKENEQNASVEQENLVGASTSDKSDENHKDTNKIDKNTDNTNDIAKNNNNSDIKDEKSNLKKSTSIDGSASQNKTKKTKK